jgi:hypothetical protein
MSEPKLLFNIYEVAARLGVSVGTVQDLMTRRIIRSEGSVYEQRIPVFTPTAVQQARRWLAEHGAELTLAQPVEESEDNL